MTRSRLLLQSILYYWRTNLAVLLGVVAGTAVIGGALVVGDSVRGSLQQMTLDRLGRIDHAVFGSQQFFREQLADDLAGQAEFSKRFSAVAPGLVLEGAFEHPLEPPGDSDQDATAAKSLRAGNVHVYGVDDRFWQLTEHGAVAAPTDRQVVLSRPLADQLGDATRPLQVGDDVTLWVELPSSIPRDTLLGDRDQVSQEITLTVAAILPEDSGVGRFQLNPQQQLPLAAFVALDYLQMNLDLAESRDRRTRRVKPARVNALFVQVKNEADATDQAAATDAAQSLTQLLTESWSLDDLRLRVRLNEEHSYLSLESEQQILGDSFLQAGRDAAEQLSANTSTVLVYLANEIAVADRPEPAVWYSIVAGMDLPTEPPFGPFEFVSEDGDSSAGLESLGEGEIKNDGTGEIVVNQWLADRLKVKTGDVLSVKYHVVGAHLLAEDGKLPEQERRFRVRGIVRLDGTPADDRGITPLVEGITNVKSFAEWDQPFPMKLPVPDEDEQYWEERQATPKAFVSLETAQHLWSSRYGRATSLRIAPPKAPPLADSRDEYVDTLLAAAEPQQIGLAFQPIKANGLNAASGTTDFAGLFFGFSFFLILSATILIGLLFRLGMERRASGIGLLQAVGYSPGQVRRQFLTEGAIVVTIGGLCGVAAAVGYAQLMVYGLKTWWIGAIGTKFLYVYVQPVSLIAGFAISVIVTLVAVWWSLRLMRRVSPRDLLSGVVAPALSAEQTKQRGRLSAKLGWANAALAGLLLVLSLAGGVPASEAFMGISWQAVAFFVVGIALLTAGVAFLAASLDSDRAAAVRGAGASGLSRLGSRNAARNRSRSVLTVGLIASATFVIVAVAAGHRNPAVEAPDQDSGNGGFLLLAETSTPILYDLNSESGRAQVNLNLDAQSDGDEGPVQFMPFRVNPGENASCLNLYQTRLPTILGVTDAMIERGGFKFIGADRDNPWTLLKAPVEHEEIDGRQVPVYPVFGDLNTLQYSLHLTMGDTLPVPNADRPDYKLKVAGMFDGSVFQGVLLMSEANFHTLYPDRAGYSYFLIEAAPSSADVLTNTLESQLNDYGFDVVPVAQRLANFLEVQNTYLSTFQTLGGLGLLLGTLGLSTVMLRNVLERRSELALLRAIGFRNAGLAWLVLWENALLLTWGLLAGTISALLAMAPHLQTTGADLPWKNLAIILAAVFLAGTLAALLAVRAAVRTPIVQTLRSE